MDSDGSDIDVTELDDCLRELEAIDISDLELSDSEQNLDVEKSPVHEEDVHEETESKALGISKEKSFLPSCEVERNAEPELEGTAKINYPSRCIELGENHDIGKSRLSYPIEDEESKSNLAFQTDLSVTELRQILQTTIQKGILENKKKSEISVELSDTTPVVKDSVKLSNETKREETKQLVSTLVQHLSHVEPILSPETTFTPKLESTPKTECHKVREEDDSCRLDDTTFKLQLGTILKQEVPDPVPEDSEAVLSENESPAVLKRASSEASLSSCETVIFERRSPVAKQRLCRMPSSDAEQRLCRMPSSDTGDIEEDRRPSNDVGSTEEGREPLSDIGDIEEVILVKSILQNLEALEACDDLEAISPDSMSSPPPVERLDKAVSADENDIDYKKGRRRKRRKRKRTRKRHDRKKKEDNEKDGVSDASSFSSDDFLEHEKKPPRSLDYLKHCPSKKRSPSNKTHDRRSPSSSPNRSLPFPPPKKQSSKISLLHSPHSSEPLRYKPQDVHYERKLRREGSSASPSPSRSRCSSKKLRSAVKKCSAVTSRSPTHSPPHRSLHSRYTKKRHEPLRSRSKSPKRRYRRRSRSRSFSPHSKKYSTTARQKYRKSSRHSESPSRPSPDVRSNSPLERKISRRLKKLESLRKASRRRSKSRSCSPKIKPCSSNERKADFESLRDSKSPKKSSQTVKSNSPPAKDISESVKKLPSPSSSVSRQNSSPRRRISSPVPQQSSTCPMDNAPSSGPVAKPETNSESLPKPSSSSSTSPEENTAVRTIQSPEKKVLPAVESRTPSPPPENTKTSKPEPMDISPTPETKLLKETSHPVLNADFTKLPPVPSLVMQLPAMWSQPPPPGTLPVCDTHTLPPPPGTLPYGVQQLPSASTAQHTIPLQSQQQMHSSFGYSHPQVQGTYQNGSPCFGLPVYSQNNNQNSFQQSLYGQSSRHIGCQNFTFPQVPSSSSNPVGPTQFQSTYNSPVTRQDMSVPPPVYNQSQKYQSNRISHNIAQYPPQAGNHTAPYIMQSAQSQTQIKINVQQVLQPQNTNNQSLTRTSPFASCRDPRLKDINISVSCETPVPSVGTQLNTATISDQSNGSPTQKVLTNSQVPLPGQPPLPPGQPPLPPGQPPPLPSGQLPPLPLGQPPPLPPGQPPPLPPGQPPLPPKEMKIEQPPLPKSPPPPSTPPSNKMSKAQQDNPSMSSTAQPQQPSTNISHLQLKLKNLLPKKDGRNQESESVTTASGSEWSDSQRENKEDIHECVCDRSGVEKKTCLRCLYRKREKLEQASVFSKAPNLCRTVKRPIVVNLLHKRKTQPVTAIVKPNVHEIQTSSSSSEQPHQQGSVMTAFNSNSLHSETRSQGSTESVPILTEQRIDEQCPDILNDESTVGVQKMSYPGHQTNLMHGDTSSSPKNSGITADVSIDQVSVMHKQDSPVDGSEKMVTEDKTHNLETEQHTKESVKNDEHKSEIKESVKDCVVPKQKDIDLNQVKSTSVQISNETCLNNRYVTYVITGNKVNKKVLTSVILGNIGSKENSVLRRTYRSKSADSMVDSLKQAAKEYAKLPKDDLLHTVGNSSLMHNTNILENNTPLPVQNAEENQDENNSSVSSSVQQIDQEKINTTKKPVSKYQITFSEKVKENDALNNREVSAACAKEKSKETLLVAHIPNNNGNLDNASPKPSDICLSEIKLECVGERSTQDIFGSAIPVKEEPLGSDVGDAEKRSKIIGEAFTKLNSAGGIDLGSVCSVEKTKCHEKQKQSLHLNSNATASIKMAECNFSGSAVCSGENVANTNIQYKSFKNENSDPSVSKQTERQSLHIDTEHCTQDERMSTATDSAPVRADNEFKMPINKDSSSAEGGKVAITAESDTRVIDTLENVQQPIISVTQNNSQEKDKGGLLDNVVPKVRENVKVAHALHEKSVCHIGELMQEKPCKKIAVESKEEKDTRKQKSCLPDRALNISVSDSSDSDIIELPTTIDLCLSDDADDMQEVSISRKVLPIVDVTNEKPIVLSDPECITIDSSPKKEISQTNIESIDLTPSISSAPLIGPQENCVSVTGSTLPAEQLHETPCLSSNFSKSPIQRKAKPLLQMQLEVSLDDSKQQSNNKRGEVAPTKPGISRSPPKSKPFITDSLLLQMKPAPRSVKLQHAAILQDKHVHDKLCDLNPVEGQNKSTQKIELDRQSAVRDTETKDTLSFSEKNVKGDSLQNKRNFSVLSDSSNNENTSDVNVVAYADSRGEINAPPNIQLEYGEPCLKKQKRSPLIKNDERRESNQTVSIRDNPKHARRSTLSVTVLQPISIMPSESREGTLSSQVQRHSSRILRSPQKNSVIFAKYMGSTDFNPDEDNCSNEDITTTQMEKLISKSEKTIKKYPHRSQLPSYAVSRRILINRLRRCPVVLQANLKKMAKLLRQDSKLTQIPLVILEQIDLQSEQNKKIIQNLDLKRSVSRCCCCQVLCRSIATQTDSNHAK